MTISDLNSFLGSDGLVFYLNLNEGALDSGQDLLAYADIYLTDLGTDNAVGGVDAAADTVKTYTLSGDYCSYGVYCPTLSSDGSLPNESGWANIAANTTAFGIYSAELDKDVKSGPWDIMSVDFRMGYLGNIIAQLSIIPTVVPEPGTLAVVSLGLFGLYRMRRRRQQNQQNLPASVR